MIYRYYESCKSYKLYKIVEGKVDCIENNFDIDQVSRKLLPIHFDNDDTKLSVFIEDYDINLKSLNHIIEERKERFLESIQNKDSRYIKMIVMNSLKLGLRMQSYDLEYVKNIFSNRRFRSWVLPFYMDKSIYEEPDLVMIIRKNDMFFEIKTILLYDDYLKNKIVSMSPYCSSWG